MTTAICTLFEGNYHYGVVGLTNSLYQNGFRGSIYAGYRGALPNWASSANDNSHLELNIRSLQVAEELQLHFVYLDTDNHFTNYKPDFMLKLWDSIAKDIEIMFYFDPDIVVTAPWNYIEEWPKYGIAVCEDIKSPLEKFHPRRIGWRKFYKKYGIELTFKNSIYVNGGFIGIRKDSKSFLENWQNLQLSMGEHLGGLSRSSITPDTKLSEEFSFDFSPFGATDQDALNATIEASDLDISYMRKEAMALVMGGPVLMPHALGQPKPWDYKPINRFMKGRSPRFVEKQYWKFVEYPIKCYPRFKVRRMRFFLKLFSFLGRFYKV